MKNSIARLSHLRPPLLLMLVCASPLFAMAAPECNDSSGGDQQTTLASCYRPMTKTERRHWLIHSTIGPKGLAVDVPRAGWKTALNDPKEYEPNVSGFAKRYGVRLSEVAVG